MFVLSERHEAPRRLEVNGRRVPVAAILHVAVRAAPPHARRSVAREDWDFPVVTLLTIVAIVAVPVSRAVGADTRSHLLLTRPSPGRR
jgi:hypothetical protein